MKRWSCSRDMGWRAGERKHGMVPCYTQQVKYPNIRISYCTVGGCTNAHRQLAIKLHSFESLCSGTQVLCTRTSCPWQVRYRTAWWPWNFPWADRERSWEGFARAIGDNGVGWAGLGLPEAASGVWFGCVPGSWVKELTHRVWYKYDGTYGTDITITGGDPLWLAGGVLASAYVLMSHMPRAFNLLTIKRDFPSTVTRSNREIDGIFLPPCLMSTLTLG